MAQATHDVIPEHPALATARVNKKMEAAIERLLAALDALDAPEDDREPDDPREENGDLEPYLGWAAKEARTGRYNWLSTEDREHEHCGREPEAFL